MDDMKRAVLIVGTSSALLVVLLTATNPKDAPVFLLVAPFILLFIVLFAAGYLLMRHRWSRHRSIHISGLLAAVPVLLLIMQSVGQLTSRDLITIAAIFLIGYFYVLRSSPAR